MIFRYGGTLGTDRTRNSSITLLVEQSSERKQSCRSCPTRTIPPIISDLAKRIILIDEGGLFLLV